LLNSGTKEVQISSITAQPSNAAIRIDYAPLKLEPTEATYTRVANISFDGKLVFVWLTDLLVMFCYVKLNCCELLLFGWLPTIDIYAISQKILIFSNAQAKINQEPLSALCQIQYVDISAPAQV